MNTVKLNKALKTSLPCLRKGRLLRLLFFLFTQISFAQPDKQVFDLNDPRNPDCPCHKYQKMANEEYEKLQKKNKLKQLDEVADVGNVQNLNVKKQQLKDSESASNPPYSNYTKKKKRKIVKRKIHKHINLFSLRFSKTKRFKPCYSVCFKW